MLWKNANSGSKKNTLKCIVLVFRKNNPYLKYSSPLLTVCKYVLRCKLGLDSPSSTLRVFSSSKIFQHKLQIKTCRRFLFWWIYTTTLRLTPDVLPVLNAEVFFLFFETGRQIFSALVIEISNVWCSSFFLSFVFTVRYLGIKML